MQHQTTRSILSASCLFLALFFLVQTVGLLFVQRIAARVADRQGEVLVPLSVRFVGVVAEGVVADRLHSRVLDEPLHPDGSNWPAAFRWFFVLELCGLAGLSIGFAQLGLAILRTSDKWKGEATTLVMSSIVVLVLGLGFLTLI